MFPKSIRVLILVVGIVKVHLIRKQCLHKDLVFINWRLMSALASLKRFGEEDFVFINWRSCRHCLQNESIRNMTSCKYNSKFIYLFKIWDYFKIFTSHEFGGKNSKAYGKHKINFSLLIFPCASLIFNKSKGFRFVPNFSKNIKTHSIA